MAKTADICAVDVLIAGAGAAGMMCAIESAHRGRKTLVLERNPRGGRKILISGGGRCNFTNVHTSAENFLSRNPHFAKSALARYTPRDFIALVEKHQVRYHEKKLGQLFCDGSAEEILALLERECAGAGAQIVTSCDIHRVTAKDGFEVESDRGVFLSQSLVVASGGLSIPKTGATGFAYRVARQFELPVAEPRPALVPLLFGRRDAERFHGLAGVSVDAMVSAARGPAFREKLLFTHHGLSGPAILQASSYWTPGEEIGINLLPDTDIERGLRDARGEGSRSQTRDARGWLGKRLPASLAARWAELHFGTTPLAALGDRKIGAIAGGLRDWRITPAGTAGFEKAEVTAGGVDTAALSSQSFEARDVPGLYFIGEAVDVTGQLGGFNFQWAWASGYSAGQYV